MKSKIKAAAVSTEKTVEMVRLTKRQIEMTMDELLAFNTTRPSLLVLGYNDQDADESFLVVEEMS